MPSINGILFREKVVSRACWLAVFLWLCLLSFLIWRRVQLSEQIPVFDAFEYYAKAKHFWDAIFAGKVFNPLGVEPSFRPVGTVLMSYPFGFSADPRPFYFRSVILGIIAFVIAVRLVTFSDEKNRASLAWGAIVALSGSVLPMFYHFEPSDHSPTFWGLVDCFFAGLAALAAAAVVRAVSLQSIIWTAIAISVSAYSLLVKPSGIFVMGLTAASWFSGLTFSLLSASGNRRKTLSLLGFGTLAFMAVFGGLVWMCTHSPYLSHENIVYGSNAMENLKHDWSSQISFQNLVTALHPSFGLCFPLALVLPLLALAGMRGVRSYPWHVAAGALALLVGLWLWIVTSGANQVRYFYPFALAAIVFMLPPLSLAFATSKPAVKCTATALFATPALVTLCLLVISDRLENVERLAGISLDSGAAPPESKQADELLDDLRRSNTGEARLYLFTAGGAAERSFSSKGLYEALIHPHEKGFGQIGPVDWLRPSGYRLEEIITSDYILVAPIYEPSRRSALLTKETVEDLSGEVQLFRAWGSDLGPNDGLLRMSAMPNSILYKVVDREKLESSLARLRAAHQWRPEFQENNPALWWSHEMLDEELSTHPASATEIRFGSIYKIDAIRVTWVDATVKVDVWWSGPTQSTAETPWRIFIHLLDAQGHVAQGHILRKAAMSLADSREPNESRMIRFHRSFFAPPSDAKSIALGIYDGKTDFLIADTGNRDWNNRRVVVSIPAPAQLTSR
jgi:hypothetical protein